MLFNCPYLFKIPNIPIFFPKYPYLLWIQPILPIVNLRSLSLRLPAVCGGALSAGPLQCMHRERQEQLLDKPGDSKAILEVQRGPLFAHNVHNIDAQAL